MGRRPIQDGTQSPAREWLYLAFKKNLFMCINGIINNN